MVSLFSIVLEKLIYRTPTNGEIVANANFGELSQPLLNFRESYPEALDSQILVLIPAFNEEGSIGEVVRRVPPKVCSMATTTIVINDGSLDNTAKTARSCGACVLQMPRNSGQGAALKAGYLLALQIGSQYVAVVDGDGQWDPQDIEPLIHPLVSGLADFSQGSRRLGKSEVGDRFRDLGVAFYSRLISLLVGTHVGDTSSGLRAYRREVLEKVRLAQNQYQSSEILISAICTGARLYEYPVTMSARTAGRSKKASNWKYGLLYLRATTQAVFRERVMAIKVRAIR